MRLIKIAELIIEDVFKEAGIGDVPHLVNMDRKVPQMKKIKTDDKYNYWIGADIDGKPYYNITSINDHPATNFYNKAQWSGYYNSDWISKVKGVPNIFKQSNQSTNEIQDKEFPDHQDRITAREWWSSLSINDMKMLSKKHGMDINFTFNGKPISSSRWNELSGSDLVKIWKAETHQNSPENINEKLILKKYTPKNLLIAMSDHPDAKNRSAETYKAKDALKAAGFKWGTLSDESGKQVSAWLISADLARKAQDAINSINKENPTVDVDGKQTTGDQAKFEELVFDLSTISKKSGLDQKIVAFIDKLKSEVDTVRSAEEFQKYINFRNKFRQYSFTNTMLIYIQKPNATKVAGLKKWETMNRRVKKGATAITIFVPKFKKEKSDGPYQTSKNDNTSPTPQPETNLDKQVHKQTLDGFMAGSVFDISDTEVIAGKEDGATVAPQWHSSNDPHELADKISAYVEDIIKTSGIDYTRDASSRGEGGYAMGGTHINISADSAGANKASTLVHELAHILLHFNNSLFSDEQLGHIPASIKEFQAEAVAASVMDEYGIPYEHSKTYIALWNEKLPQMQEYTNMITKAAGYIIDQIAERDSESGQQSGQSVQTQHQAGTNLNELKRNFIKFLNKGKIQ